MGHNQVVTIDLETIFSDQNGEEFSLSVDANSNENIVSAEITDNILTLTTNNSQGAANITIKASNWIFDISDTFIVYSGLVLNTFAEDNFENGEFSLEWQNQGDIDWNIDTSIGFESSFSAKSGDIANDEISSLILEVDFPYIGGNINFDLKVSCEAGYDKYRFYIDDVLQSEWSGEYDWFNESYSDLSSGLHSFRWTYDKDAIYSAGEDCVWLDNVNISGYDIQNVNINNNYELAIKNYELKQNYPNPFNPHTRINFELPITSYKKAEIVIYNSMGQSVWLTPIGEKNLLSVSSATSTHGSLQFDGSNLNSGIYYYSLIIDKKIVSTKSMVLIK